MLRAVLAITLSIALAGKARAQFVFPITSGDIQAWTDPGTPPNQVLNITLPGPGSVLAVQGTIMRSAVGYAFESSPNSATLNFDTEQYANAGGTGGGWSYMACTPKFTPLGPVGYSISGHYEVTGVDAAVLKAETTLRKSSTEILFKHTAVRVVQPGQSIVVGVAEPGELLVGSLTGTLLANTVYTFSLSWSLDGKSLGNPQEAAGVASITLTQESCYADCNTDGSLTVADFGCFQTKFVAGEPYADCNADGSLTVADFGCFQTAFVAGCP